MTPEAIDLLKWAVGVLVPAGAVWGAIRADIKNIHERVTRIEDKVWK